MWNRCDLRLSRDFYPHRRWNRHRKNQLRPLPVLLRGSGRDKGESAEIVWENNSSLTIQRTVHDPPRLQPIIALSTGKPHNTLLVPCGLSGRGRLMALSSRCCTCLHETNFGELQYVAHYGRTLINLSLEIIPQAWICGAQRWKPRLRRHLISTSTSGHGHPF